MAKPFLKWAGGKSQLISEIESRLPKDLKKIDTYVEPFIGGGALLFHMLEKYDFKNIHISDINPELILCYRQIQSSVDDVITSLRTLIGLYPEDEVLRSEFFYKIRELWNSNLDIESMTDKEKSERVAQMIFLNKTCFNGLFRVNKSGRFNVPTGRYKKPSFTTPEALKEVSVALQGVTIHHGSYEECLNWVDDKSFVYFDPPYRPLSKTSSFNSYSKGDFNDEDQRRCNRCVPKFESARSVCSSFQFRSNPILYLRMISLMPYTRDSKLIELMQIEQSTVFGQVERSD